MNDHYVVFHKDGKVTVHPSKRQVIMALSHGWSLHVPKAIWAINEDGEVKPMEIDSTKRWTTLREAQRRD